MIPFYLICIILVIGGIYAVRRKNKRRYYLLSALGVAMLLIGGIFSYQDSRPAPYYKLGTPVSKIKSNNDVKSHFNGSYYTIDGRDYVRYYPVNTVNNKNLISTVKFNYYESNDENNVSHKQLLQNYKKVTASDLKETSTDHYYSKKTGNHYFSEEEYDGDSISQGIIHLTSKDLAK